MIMRRSLLKAAIFLLALLFLAASAPMYTQFGQPVNIVPKHSWENKDLSPDERADLVIQQMTLDEKIQLLHGMGWRTLLDGTTSVPGMRSLGGAGFIPGIERLGIPDLQMSDAAVGVARGAARSRYSTALPSGVAEASSWDPEIAYEYGDLIGTELRDQGFNMSLGGGVNISREPRNGRTFEYKGEDPILAGTLVGEEIKGLQNQHVIGNIKHYAVNDQENGRHFANSIIDKRSMQESDLLAFQIGIRNSGVGAVMCSYNLINGTYACENDYLLHHVLDEAWRFKGFVVSDWGGTHSTVNAARAGLDIEMPGNDYFGEPLKNAVQGGEVSQHQLNSMVHRVLRTEFATGVIDYPAHPKVVDVMHGFKVAQRVEEAGAVLLKNAENQLPLNASSIKSIAVIGGHADVGVISGGGSAQVDPAGGNPVITPGVDSGDIMALLPEWVYHRSPPLDAVIERAPQARVKYNPGNDPASAAALAKSSEVAIVFAVQHESEGADLPNLALPNNQDALIQAVAAANPHTIVVLETGGAVTMPWLDQVSAVLESWYPGIRGGQAIAAILFGDVNPSGKLPITFPKSEADMPHPDPTTRPAEPLTAAPGLPDPKVDTKVFDVNYDEGLKVGYKWYDTENRTPLFPFGFGLSYTAFSYSDLNVTPGDALEVTVRVTNTGKRAGQEIAEIYAGLPEGAQEPPRRLVGWQRVALEPGESKTVTVHVEPLFLSIYNVDRNAFQLVPGEYAIWAGNSSRDLPLEVAVTLQGR
ncbi:beta-glucosidase [Mycobacterium pseudokansasii]|uniref:beta-glucosidase n=1 Tax=Mycobacterium pseudokansasii TaxID=2341080 RepID=UPI0007B52CF5|nr:glycoside hydrolase family 3 C-terminal domain-containing protein [Mycobacterium pseudokansasii]KZS65443.1 glycosyl hydrolase [Mycobacterium kansasii]VAZ95171.1 Thermostable beta-glucosidase B [Mycobacterium pseudokansasii]VAZ96379.1 Thermostable beta-glucosidase B [Mycobacterium pseudokansasii]